MPLNALWLWKRRKQTNGCVFVKDNKDRSYSLMLNNKDVQAGLGRGRGTRDQITNIHWIIEKAREFQKNIYFCFTDYMKAFDCVDHNKLWKILKEMGIPDLPLEKPVCRSGSTS